MENNKLLEAFDTLEELRRNPDAIIAYHSYLKTIIDEEAKLDYAEYKGIEKGIEMGKAEGKAEGIKIIVKKMILKGKSNEEILDIADLTLEEVEALRSELNEG